MFGEFNEEARKVMVGAKKIMSELKHPYVGSEHLVLSLLKNYEPMAKKLQEYQLDYDRFYHEIIEVIGIGTKETPWFLYTPLLKRVLENAMIDSKENNQGVVTPEHLFSSLLEEGEGVAIRILLGMNIDIDELYDEFSYKIVSHNKTKDGKKLLLEELGIDLTEKATKMELDPVVGRNKELNRMIEILCRRTKNNPILIGSAGVGKTAIVEELSRRIAYGEVPLALKNKRIISLDMATTVAGTKYRGEFEDRMRKILKEIEEHDDIILFIDEIHTLVGAGGAEGAIDASNIFKPALSRNKLRCIGATTTEEYKKFIEQDGALERRFQKLYIDVPSHHTVKEILLKLKPIYEQYHNVTLSNDILETIIKLSERYIYDRNQPDKAIDILDEVCARASLKESKNMKRYRKLNQELQKVMKQKKEAIIHDEFDKAYLQKTKENEMLDEMNRLEMTFYKQEKRKVVTKEDVAEIIHLKTKIPVYELLQNREEIIDHMKEEIENKIVGQTKAKQEVLSIARRIKLGFCDDRCYSFLFCGPSGVGKTELSKIFGELLVGHDNVIRLDMSEFSEAHSISKFVGAPPGYVGYQDHHHILEEIRNKPYSVLLLDEIEKAHPSIIHLLFQMLEEGKVKDSNGMMVHLNHAIMIMTSNVGFHESNIGFGELSENNVLTRLKEEFSVPFINRIDNIIAFHSLTKEEITELIHRKLKQLQDKYQDKKIMIEYGDDLVEEILQTSHYTDFGARRLDKIMKDEVEEQVIDAFIQNQKRVKITQLKKTTPI